MAEKVRVPNPDKPPRGRLDAPPGRPHLVKVKYKRKRKHPTPKPARDPTDFWWEHW